MACAAVFEKIGSLIEISINGRAQLFGRHVVEVFTGALGDVVVHLLLEKSELLFGSETEADGIRTTPADDVAGGDGAAGDRRNTRLWEGEPGQSEEDRESG